MKNWVEVTRFGIANREHWVKLKPLAIGRLDMARRIYAEHGAQAKGEPYGQGDDERAANGTIAEATFADHYDLPWTGGVTVKDPKWIKADVDGDIQVYTSYELSGRLIVHAGELIAEQRWVHLAGVAPYDLWFTGWTTVEDIKKFWPQLPDDPRQTSGKAIGQDLLRTPSEFSLVRSDALTDWRKKYIG